MEHAASPCQLVTQHRATFVSWRVGGDDKKCQVAEAPDLKRGLQRSRSPPRDVLCLDVFLSEIATPPLGTAGNAFALRVALL